MRGAERYPPLKSTTLSALAAGTHSTPLAEQELKGASRLAEQKEQKPNKPAQ